MDHQSKWMSAMIRKHGSEEAVREFMRESASKSARNSKGTGGFAHMKVNDPKRLKEIATKGGKSVKEKETN